MTERDAILYTVRVTKDNQMKARPYQINLQSKIGPARGLLSLRYGSGKTWISLMALERWYGQHKEHHTGIACIWFTKKKLIGTAIDEIVLRCKEVLPISALEIEKTPLSPLQSYTCLVIPHTWLTDKHSEICKQIVKTHKPYAMIWDESTKIKSAKAQISNAAHKLADIHQEVTQGKCLRMALTGNPIPEGPQELWSQFRYLYSTRNPFGTTYYRFLRSYFVKSHYGWALRLDKQRDFWFRARQHIVFMNKGEWEAYKRDLGVTVCRSRQFYDPSKEQEKLIKELNENWALANSEDDIDEYDYVMSVAQKALQITHGFYYDSTGNVIELSSNPKLDAALELLEQLLEEKDRQVLFAVHYTHDYVLVKKVLDNSKLAAKFGITYGTDEPSLHAFQTGKAKVIVLPIAKCEGFNELAVADTAILYANTFSQEQKAQFEHRIIRMSQKAPVVTFIEVCAKGMRDLEMAEAVRMKDPDLISKALRTFTHRRN